jgi:hypothetical protein
MSSIGYITVGAVDGRIPDGKTSGAFDDAAFDALGSIFCPV